jgi:hypothetical protein
MARHALLIVAAMLVLVPAGVVFAATPPPVTAPPLPDGAVFDPRTILSVADARAALVVATDTQSGIAERIARAESEQAQLRRQIDELEGSDRDLTARVESARRRMRVLAVETYVAGGPISSMQYLIDAADAGDLTWRRYMLRASVDTTREAAAAYDESLDGVSDELVALALAADRAAAELETARADAATAATAVADAELALLAARHEEDHRTGRIVVRSGDDGGPRPEESGNAAGPAWEKLRFCESGGNYAIADSSGMFRGAYQFAISTWAGLGGNGDAADAPPSEQDYRAQVLYDALGAKPWPVCGRFLLEDPPARAEPLPGLLDRLPPDEVLAGPGITTPSTTTTSSSTTSTSTSTTTSAPPPSNDPP